MQDATEDLEYRHNKIPALKAQHAELEKELNEAIQKRNDFPETNWQLERRVYQVFLR